MYICHSSFLNERIPYRVIPCPCPSSSSGTRPRVPSTQRPPGRTG
jgi:hypothetical protein